MKTTPDNPPAFPTVREYTYSEGTGTEHIEGMTLRDYFAGQALMGMLDNPYSEGARAEETAVCAYNYAEAMLARREKGAADE